MRKYFTKTLILMLFFLITSCSIYEPLYKNPSIFSAAINGDLDEVKRYLEEGVNVNTEDKDGDTALTFAAREGHIHIINFLIKNGANLDAKGSSDHAALHWSAVNGDSDIVTALINAGADINIRTVREMTPLIYAAGKGKKDIVEILIANEKCDISAVMDTDSNALMEAVAVKSGNEAIVTILLDKSKVVNSNNGIKDDTEYQAYIDAKRIFTGTALMIASENGNLENVNALIEAGAYINLQNNHST